MSRHVASPSRGVQSTVRNRRVDRKFKPRVLRQIQTGAERTPPRFVEAIGHTPLMGLFRRLGDQLVYRLCDPIAPFGLRVLFERLVDACPQVGGGRAGAMRSMPP
jgi:hypothetical protein